MKKFIYITIMAFLTLGNFACDKDFLDVRPTESTESSETIVTLADARVMLNGLMRNLIDLNYLGRNMLLYADAKGGDLTLASQGRGLDGLYVYNHDVNIGNYSGFWSNIYNSILQANNIISGIENLEAQGTTIDFSDIKGQALTIRAMLHFDLVRLYGKTYTDDPGAWGVPVVTEVLDASELPLRNTVEEVYTQILADLNAGGELLSQSRNNGYINYYGNRGILSRVYLTMGRFAEALTAAEEIIQSPLYSLYSNSEWVDSWSGQFGDESIFELKMEQNEGALGASSLGFYYLRRGENNALGNFIASDYFLERLGEDPDDVRWGIMTYDEISDDRMGAIYKYVGSVDKSGDGKEVFTAVNMKIIRLSEIYLNAAEAALKSSTPDREKAAEYLNAIRQRSPNLEPVTAASITEQHILDERSKELIGEGHRFWDLIRTNQTIRFNDELLGINVTHRPTEIDRTFYKTLLPIALSEINRHPGLGDQQNPGY